MINEERSFFLHDRIMKTSTCLNGLRYKSGISIEKALYKRTKYRQDLTGRSERNDDLVDRIYPMLLNSVFFFFFF